VSSPADTAGSFAAAVMELRDLIGVEQPVIGWNSSAHEDGVRHFARGYGDDDPRWGVSAVPASFLYSVCSGGRPSGLRGPAEVLRGTGALWLNDAWTYHRPVAVGAPLVATVTIADVQLTTTRSRGEVALIDEHFAFRDPDGAVADYTKRTMRFRRQDSTPAPAGTAMDPWASAPRYGEAELDELAALAVDEVERRRGSQERYADSVSVGDDLGTLRKGPLSITSVVAWVSGWGSPFIETDRVAHLRWGADPSLRLTVPSTGRPESIESPHWDPEMAAVAGMPRGYDFGPQRMAWLQHLVTDWAGDAARIVSMEGRLTRPNLLGDLTIIGGTVVAVLGDLVTCRVVAQNQREEETADAVIGVRLPTSSRS
jgi:hypothetical protein